jgi:hypothetical protein
MDPATAAISILLWIAFSHYSQQFDWIGFYVWAINDFRLNKSVVRALVLMPFLRWLGDSSHKILAQIFPNPHLASVVFPAPFWYLGEIFGDSYLPVKALALLQSQHSFQRHIVRFNFCMFAGIKVANVVFRFYGFFSGMPREQFFNTLSVFDSVTSFVGVFCDLVCCGMMIWVTQSLLKSVKRNILVLIRNSSIFRLSLATTLTLLSGIFGLFNRCETDQHSCAFGFLRDAIITIDYQFYYLDYLLTQADTHKDKSSKNTFENSNK